MTEDRQAVRGPCPHYLPLAILLTLFYGLPRMAFDSWRERRR